MPPQPTQRMVQYSAPARPSITRKTRSGPLQSGQSDRTAVGEDVLGSGMSNLPLLLRDDRPPGEIIDRGLGIGDGGFHFGPGEADLDLGERDAVDDDGLKILTPDPGVAQASSGFESLDLKAVIVHDTSPPIRDGKA